MKFLSDLGRDIALGIRLLARYPGFSAISIATLAAATGGNTAVFTIVNALLLTPPPVLEPARLASVDTGQSLTSWPIYEDIRDRTDVFVSVAAARLTLMSLELGGTSIRLRGQVTSPNYLTALGVVPARGRLYDATDTDVARVVLAHHIWVQHFGADPEIVGRTILMAGRSFQVAGIMPPGFRALAPPGVRLDFWIPVNPVSDRASLGNRLLSQFEIVGRLKPGLDHATATAALRTMAHRLRLEHPELAESILAIEAGSVEGANAFRGMASLLLPVFAFLALLAVISAFVLIIGCSNIAGLLVGRAAMRQREIAVRLSLGASGGRLVQQLLTESLVLAIAGGTAGLLLARGLVGALSVAVARLPVPLDLTFALDYRVLVYLLALSTATAMFFGFLPARHAIRVDLASSLKVDNSGAPARLRLRRFLVTAQVAICSALILWSILFVRSLGKIHAIDAGFDATGIVLATIELDRGAIDAAHGDQLLTEWTQRVAATPRVQSAGLATVVPLALTGREEFDVSLPGDAAGTRRRVVANRITPGWFATVHVALVGGRDFSWADRSGSPRVAIVNETLARQFWGGEAVGQRLRFGDRSIEIIGIAKDSKYRTLGEDTRPLIYLPLRQEYAHLATLFARTSDARATADVMTHELQRLLPGTDVTIESMTEAVAVAVLPARIGAAVTGGFAAIAMALAALGVYGLVSFSVIQRTREIGIRRAIGATTADILRLVVGGHSMRIGFGLFIGGTIGALGARVFRSFLAGVGPADPVALFAVVVVVGGCALLASTVPALRATRGDPIAALRDL